MDPHPPSSPEQPVVTPRPVSAPPGYGPPPGPPYAGPAPRPRSSGWLRLLIILLVGSALLNLVLLGSLGSRSFDSSKVKEKHHSLVRRASHKVAIIRVSGSIVSDEGFVKHQIDRLAQDETIKAVVLRIDSPGGSVSTTDYLYHQLSRRLEERKIPLVVSMGGICASGGYYLAMAVGKAPNAAAERIIFAEPTTWTGSIGVIIPHYDLSQLLAEWKVSNDSIASHELKQLGAMTRQMSDQEREILQALVDDAFDRFKTVIRDGRPRFARAPAELDALATGQVFSAGQAVATGLVDAQGYLEDAIERAIELAELPADDVEAVEFEQPFDLFGGLMATAAARPAGAANLLEQCLDLASPRAFYHCSFVPGLLTPSATK